MLNRCWIFAAAWLMFFGSSSEVGAGSSAFLRGGVPYTIDIWETDDGLPQNSVIALTQSRDGYLWLGTLRGLVRFDGIQFTVFDQSNTPGLPSSRIASLFEDGQGNLWIGSESAGAALIQAGRVISLDIGRGASEARLMATCQDSSGAVWLYTADGQLCRHRDGRVDVWSVAADVFSSCRTIIPNESGSVWVGTDRRLFAIGPTTGLGPTNLPVEKVLSVDKLDFLLASHKGGYWRMAAGRVQKWRANQIERDFGPYPWERAGVLAACEDQEGNLVVGTRGEGVFWFDSEGKVTRLSMEEGLSHNYILSLTVDREGSLWVGTDGGGLNRVKRQAFAVLEDSRGLVVQSVCEDGEGGLWIGYNGGGIDHWKKGVRQRWVPRLGSMDLAVRAVFADRNRRVWAGTWGGGLFELQNGEFQRAVGTEAIHPFIQAIHQDRHGQLWVGTRGGLARWDDHRWKVFTTRDGLSADVVQAIADDSAGNLWVGTVGGGLNRLRDGQFTAFRNQVEDVSSLWVDEDGVLWIGSPGDGLSRFDGVRWTRYTTREGLIDDNVGYLTGDGQGYLWIGSTVGLMRVSMKALNQFAQGLTTMIPGRIYRKPDGLPTRECTMGSQPGACRTREGKLWVSTIKGLASVIPAQLQPNPHRPPLMIESVLVEGQPQKTNALRAGWPQLVIIPPGKQRLEIHYTSLNLAAPERARFKYRLEGHETDWTDAGNSRIARYSKLPPGKYRFQVTACNEDGVWNETGGALGLIVEPPFWRTWWFLSASLIGFLGAIIAVVHYLSTQRLQRQLEWLRQQQALQTERSRIARDIHDQLGASLTQVSLLGELVESDKDSPADVEAHSRLISQTARDTTRILDEIVWAVNPTNDTLDGLITYICKHAQEYLTVAGLRYRVNVPAQLPATPIPPEVRHNVFLAAKEALTNVIRHAQASSVCIQLRLEPPGFILEIEDNGRGLSGLDEKEARARNGLQNMRKRMDDIGGNFTIGPAPKGGTLVRLIGRLTKAEEERAGLK